MLMQSYSCYCEASDKDSLQIYINYVESHYTDLQLIDSMIEPNRFDDCDYLTFAIIYNYIINCKNEDAAEGIFDRMADAQIHNDLFESKFIKFCSLINVSSEFMDKVVYEILFHIIASDESHIRGIERSYYLKNKIHQLMPQDIKDFYLNRNRCKSLHELIENAINNIR